MQPNLRLAFDASDLPPAEAVQAEPREPYVPQWMLDEGHAAFRDRRAARNVRILSRLAVVLVVAGVFAVLRGVVS
jgi:hypothetical protein